MAPKITSSKITLSCPLFAADFDPHNHGFLLVGGGGGEGRSGVGNKISLLDTSRREVISEVVEIELSREEDSVTSLGVLQCSNNDVVALAGINSSQAEQKRENNKHLRSFEITYPSRRKPTINLSNGDPGGNDATTSEPKTRALSQVSLFRPQASKTAEGEAYQRVLRLSPWKGEDSRRIGAIATGLAPRGELVLFEADVQSVAMPNVLGRVMLGAQEEVEDVDIIDTSEDGTFKLAYTDGQEVYLSNVSISSKSNLQVNSIYKIAGGRKSSKIRALRFITPSTLLLLQNYHGRTGCELLVISLSNHVSKWTVSRRRRLHRSMKIGLGLDICRLSQSLSGENQCIIAVSGSDMSIEVLTLESALKGQVGKLQHYTTFTDVHPFSMTKIAFSTFISPTLPVTSEVRPQFVKLASVSVGNTVIVHTFPLSPYPTTSKHPRYVLVNPGPSELANTIFSSLVAIFVVALGAFFLQAFTEIRGGVPPTLGATNWLSPRLREMLARPYMFENGHPNIHPATHSLKDIPQVKTTSQPLQELISSLSQSREGADPASEQPREAIVVHDLGSEISAQSTVLPDRGEKGHGIDYSETKKWEDLSEEQRRIWKKKLADAGHWALDEGEVLLRGVLFGELAGFVGHIMA
ncbi:hypothetical protein McanMca71_002856 [Microsporum canis]|uniref:Guanine nucleotide-exchange factor SEC12 n=1 Tax=Arthroderma otae (strain ATCC MYA-4605 / CBS 113480) TaxID=554155 RepID=C5FVL7_ARTOC|nr:conserved hypothetical protein [Microsporum canis CBS 113480]EEQ33951.1 conserved hypothetical protein [Microsporum canis CBS 113480]